jgi:hypothetical protein
MLKAVIMSDYGHVRSLEIVNPRLCCCLALEGTMMGNMALLILTIGFILAAGGRQRSDV